jgi:hypothetical protein
VPQHVLPLRGTPPPGHGLVYTPALLGIASSTFEDARLDVRLEKKVQLLAPLDIAPGTSPWQGAPEIDIDPSELEREPAAGARFAALAPGAAKPRSYEAWKRDLANVLYREQALDLWKCPSLKLVSKPGESERDFRVRLQEQARERRDAEVEALRARWAPKLARLQEQLRRAEQAREREAEQLRQQKVQTAVSFGATLLGAFLGGKRSSRSSIGRATTAARGVGRAHKEAQDVSRADANQDVVEQRLQALNAQFEAEVAALAGAPDAAAEPLVKITLRPKKAAVQVAHVGLVWTPRWQAPDGTSVPAWGS